MSTSNGQDGSDNLCSLQYAHGVASLFSAQSASSSSASTLAGFHGLRFKELQGAAGISIPAGQAGVGSHQTCRRCGNLVVPGLTGSAKLARKEQSNTIKRPRKNTMQWTCNCGWQTGYAGSDPSAKRKFKKARLSNDGKYSGAGQPASAAIPPVSSPAPPTLEQPILAPSKPVDLTPVPSSANKPVAKTATPPYVPAQSPKPQPSKKKRTKKEGLQAMLQARKQTDDKDKNVGGLRLSSFLQGL